MANYHSGVLEGVAGRLGLAGPGEKDPPHSTREGVNRCYATSVTLVLKTEVEAKGDEPVQAKGARWEVDGGLHTGYESDFVTHRADEVHPIFTAPVLPGLISEMDKLCLSKPAKPPTLRGPLSEDELWVTLHHSSYSQGKDLSDQLVKMANKYLNPPPLGPGPVPPLVPPPDLG